MSYSFSVRGITLAAALAAAAVRFDDEITRQPIHSRDKDTALGAADAAGKLLGPQPDGQVVILQMSGSVSWSGGTGDANTPLLGANVSVGVYYTIANEAELAEIAAAKPDASTQTT